MAAMTATTQRVFLLLVLMLLICATRVHLFDHFSIPDASWAAFFIAGFQLRGWGRWAFPLLLALAVAVDWYAITSQGIDFWSHYCVSPAYWCLAAAYGVLWLGGAWLRRHYHGASWEALGRLVAALTVSVVACHFIAQGSFYWISDSVTQPTAGGWWKNYTDWLPPYLVTAAGYVTVAALLQVAAERVAPLLHGGDRTAH